MTEENSSLKENNQNVSYFGFLTFIKRRCVSGYYTKSCFGILRTCGAIILGIILVYILIFSFLHIVQLLLTFIGLVIQHSEVCALTQCKTDMQISDFNITPFSKIYSNNTCCSCNMTSHTYTHINNFRHNIQDTCNTNGMHDIIDSGLLFVLLVILPSCIVFILCIIICNPICKCIKNKIILQWNEYINKKIDSRLTSFKQKTIGENIKDSNIIYPDIESGEISRLLYDDQHSNVDIIYYKNNIDIDSRHSNEVKSVRSLSSDVTSEDGIMINADDAI
jgi:hypothetical protein